MDRREEPPWNGTEGPETEAGIDPEADFRALAEDWIAIWQSEITTYLTDPETQQAWGAMMAIWAGAAQTMMRAMPTAPKPYERRRKRAQAQPPRSDAAPGAAPAAAAPVARDDEVRRLEQRVAELERQLAEDRRRGAAGENRRTRRSVRPRG